MKILSFFSTSFSIQKPVMVSVRRMICLPLLPLFFSIFFHLSSVQAQPLYYDQPQLNVLYVGIDNLLRIGGAKTIDSIQLFPTAFTGRGQEPNTFIVNTTYTGQFTLQVYAGGKIIDSKTYRSIQVPNPTFNISAYPRDIYYNAELTAKRLAGLDSINCKMGGLAVDLGFRVDGLTIRRRREGSTEEREVIGAKFTPEIRNWLVQSRPKDQIDIIINHVSDSIKYFRKYGFYFTIAADVETKAGEQWMADNVNVDCFRNGDKIPQAQSVEEWIEAGKKGQPAWCYFENNPLSQAVGRLYNKPALLDPRGLLPAGYRLPTKKELQAAGKMMNMNGGGRREYDGEFHESSVFWCEEKTGFGFFEFAGQYLGTISADHPATGFYLRGIRK